MKEQVWFKARVISSHGKHSFVEKEDGTVLEATRKGKKVDLTVGDIVECLQTSPEQVSIQKIEPRRSLLYRSDELRTKPLASNINQVAIIYNKDEKYASAINVLSTLSCIVTMPLWVMVYQLLIP